ncbi:uncharacterized protein PHALS_04025 [Plasmopara halstedii]|uniref:Uncharacterized protein n=1 Tax=Plasmopara halstedii TaxID=4781 RepID=A0A0P1A7X3_PLAHL|nr:uncharacterized protein PHALS_04025 [Plasmopara halstedii]CEG36776.1 hypothetical protein PHALS_04025 [Plasmopara halstedii]|eukprot:XP_024573145.1 hypothetical protein PHALS_04025 [Plasmopara halstedii]
MRRPFGYVPSLWLFIESNISEADVGVAHFRRWDYMMPTLILLSLFAIKLSSSGIRQYGLFGAFTIILPHFPIKIRTAGLSELLRQHEATLASRLIIGLDWPSRTDHDTFFRLTIGAVFENAEANYFDDEAVQTTAKRCVRTLFDYSCQFVGGQATIFLNHSIQLRQVFNSLPTSSWKNPAL